MGEVYVMLWFNSFNPIYLNTLKISTKICVLYVKLLCGFRDRFTIIEQVVFVFNITMLSCLVESFVFDVSGAVLMKGRIRCVVAEMKMHVNEMLL